MSDPIGDVWPDDDGRAFPNAMEWSVRSPEPLDERSTRTGAGQRAITSLEDLALRRIKGRFVGQGRRRAVALPRQRTERDTRLRIDTCEGTARAPDDSAVRPTVASPNE
jgi:hypothetical protein